MLSQTYEAEQKQLEADTARLRQEIEVQEAENDHLERFIEKARAYVGIKKLDGYMLFSWYKCTTHGYKCTISIISMPEFDFIILQSIHAA